MRDVPRKLVIIYDLLFIYLHSILIYTAQYKMSLQFAGIRVVVVTHEDGRCAGCCYYCCLTCVSVEDSILLLYHWSVDIHSGSGQEKSVCFTG